MLGLYLLAAHMVGDFLFQSRWQAAEKLTDRRSRARHVFSYTLAFAPLALLSAPLGRAGAFLGLLFVLHYATDSRRFRSSVGDVLGWRFGLSDRDRFRILGGAAPDYRGPLEPNPWPAMPLMIDQTLHVVQLAALGALFLR